MNHLAVLREVRERGLGLTVSGNDLRLQGPKQRVDAELVGRIRAVKAELIDYLMAAQAAEANSFPLTLLQRAYLIGRSESVEIGNVASHVYHEIDGCWDVDGLESALGQVIARHGMLRTRFTADGLAVTEPAVEARIDRLDLRGEPEASQQATLAALREQRSHRMLPYDRAPMLAVEVTQLADDRMRLHVGHDGLVMDGISMFLFFNDWHRCYLATGADVGTTPAGGGQPSGSGHEGATGHGTNRETDGREADVAGLSFADYVASLTAMRSKAPAQRSRAYWLDRLADLPPHPELPLRTNPSAITQPRFTQYAAGLDAASWSALKARAAAAGLTPTVVLMAAYAETLARWGAGTRFTLTTTVANRPPIHPRIADAIGNFSETLLVEIGIDRSRTFGERAHALQARLRRDLDNRHFSGIEVLRELAQRDNGGDARMPYTFNSTIGYLREDIDASALELFGPEVYTSSQTPQVWLNGFAFEQHGGVVVQFDAVNGLFPDGMIGAMVAGYQSMLDGLLEEGAWSATTFDLLPTEQRARRLAANDTAVPRPDEMLHEAFIAQAARTPDAPAILATSASVSYGELARWAARAAGWLRARHVGRDELVGLIMHRGPEQIVGILASVMAGGAYLPVDADLPSERVRYMLRDGKVRCVLTNTGWQDANGDGIDTLSLDTTCADQASLPDTLPSAVGFEPVDTSGLVKAASGAGTVNPEKTAGRADAAEAAGWRLAGADPDDLAYVLYTSGTTGEPKGVMVSHRSVANVVADCNARFAVGPADRFIGVSAFNFDLSVYDVFGALSAGAAVVLPEAGHGADPEHLLDLCDRFGVTIWNSVPALAGLMAEQAAADGGARLGALRLVMMSGDRIPPALPGALRRVKPSLTLMSLGGPTETTIWNISHPIGDTGDTALSGAAPAGTALSGAAPASTALSGAALISTAAIPYGRPNANNRAYITDADGLDTPDWVTGEICAAGTGLARGYWADPVRTAERFCYDQRRGERLYRTGDLGRYLPDGNIDIAGRSDFQIKVNGYRIEAGEVETRLAAIDVVKEAVVVRQAAARGHRLVAHLVPAGDARPSEEEIRQSLREHLPDYMTPSAVVWHESLPLTRNGKVDRGRLTAIASSAPDSTARTGTAHPGTAHPGTGSQLERELIELWASVLRVPPESVETGSNLHDLGGDSLAAARIFTGVRKRFGVSITLDRLYDVRTVPAMAAFIEAGRAGAAGAAGAA
ncbi:MAG TPA: AMP-binding protein [Streptosporangiaceae bacterium]|nr:AMP-binding protein [Streptosporangiaceae bacterium]